MSKAKSAGALVAFMWFAYFLNYCDRQAVFSMFPSLKADLKMSDAQLGYVGAMFLWVYAFGCPISGYLGDRFSKRLLVVLSLVVWSIVTIGTGLVASGVMLLAMRAAPDVQAMPRVAAMARLTAPADFRKLQAWWDHLNLARARLSTPLRKDLAIIELLDEWRAAVNADTA